VIAINWPRIIATFSRTGIAVEFSSCCPTGSVSIQHQDYLLKVMQQA